MIEDDMLNDLTIIEIVLRDCVKSEYFNENRKFAIEKIEALKQEVRKLNIDNLSKCFQCGHKDDELTSLCNDCINL